MFHKAKIFLNQVIFRRFLILWMMGLSYYLGKLLISTDSLKSLFLSGSLQFLVALDQAIFLWTNVGREILHLELGFTLVYVIRRNETIWRTKLVGVL